MLLATMVTISKWDFSVKSQLDIHGKAHSETYENLVKNNHELLQSQLGLINTNRLLSQENRNLTVSPAETKVLRGIVPICSHRKDSRDESDRWHRKETYIDAHSEAEFSHGVCPDCIEKHYPEIEYTQ